MKLYQTNFLCRAWCFNIHVSHNIMDQWKDMLLTIANWLKGTSLTRLPNFNSLVFLQVQQQNHCPMEGIQNRLCDLFVRSYFTNGDKLIILNLDSLWLNILWVKHILISSESFSWRLEMYVHFCCIYKILVIIFIEMDISTCTCILNLNISWHKLSLSWVLECL